MYCNFNQLYKIDPSTLQMWANVSVCVSDTKTEVGPLEHSSSTVQIKRNVMQVKSSTVLWKILTWGHLNP